MKKMNLPAFLLALAFCTSTTQLALAQSATLVFGGSAYGTHAFVGNTVLSGRTHS
jgi:hypothetical protein